MGSARNVFTALGLVVAFAIGLGAGWLHTGVTQSALSSTSPPELSPTPSSEPTELSPRPLSAASSVTPSPTPTRYDGTVLAYGDSVLILTEDCLIDQGFDVDSMGSRQVRVAPQELAARTSIPDRVLIHLGTNGGAYAADFDAIMEVLGEDRIVTFATIQLPDDYERYTFEDRTNDEIRALPTRYPNVRIFDWHRASDENPEWMYNDGYHPNLEGCAAYARLANAVVRAPIPPQVDRSLS